MKTVRLAALAAVLLSASALAQQPQIPQVGAQQPPHVQAGPQADPNEPPELVKDLIADWAAHKNGDKHVERGLGGLLNDHNRLSVQLRSLQEQSIATAKYWQSYVAGLAEAK